MKGITGLIAIFKGLIKRETGQSDPKTEEKLKPLYVPPAAPADLNDEWVELRCQNDSWLHNLDGSNTPCGHVFDVPKSVKFPQCPKCFWTYDYDLGKFGKELPIFNCHDSKELVAFYKEHGLMH